MESSFYAFGTTGKENTREKTYPANPEQPQHKKKPKKNHQYQEGETCNCLKIEKKSKWDNILYFELPTARKNHSKDTSPP